MIEDAGPGVKIKANAKCIERKAKFPAQEGHSKKKTIAKE
jgi:hypothetical protein